MRKSSAKGTKKLPSSAFAYPKKRAYPINTPKRARAALSRAAQKKTSGSYAHVARAVKRRYPSIKVGSGRRKKR
jgi:hypothetical protein